jgi:CBS domain-containing protein
MHRGVVACGPELPALAVARIMAAHRIHSVVVKGVPLTVITDAEIAAALCAGGLGPRSAGDLARPAAIVARDETLIRAIEVMRERETTHAVVVDEVRALRAVGVVSVLDIAEVLVEGSSS